MLDVLTLQVCFVAAYLIRHKHGIPYLDPIYLNLGIVFVIVDVFVAVAFNTMHNVLRRGYYREFVSTFQHVAYVLFIMSLYLFSNRLGDNYSRITLCLTSVFHLILGYVVRILWKGVIREMVKDNPRVSMILVAKDDAVPEVISNFSYAERGNIKGIVFSNRDGKGEVVKNIPVVANLGDAADYICRAWVDEVFVYPAALSDLEVKKSAVTESMEGFIDDEYEKFSRKEYKAKRDVESSDASVATLIEQCRQMAVPVHIRLPLSNIGGKSFVEKVGGYKVLTTTTNYASGRQLACKRLIDIVGGLVGSIFAILIMLVIGPIIKIKSPGPILFKQTRIGQNGKPFKIYKIRSMHMDAEERKKELLEKNRVSDDRMFKLDFDPRIIGNEIVDGRKVSGIGEFIRKYSIDEFPQFFNVLMNQMSIVGTRPPTVDEWEKYKYHHRARLATKPGVTGLWQVSGRSDITDFEEVVKLDTEYIDHWSISLDIRIILKTLKVVVRGEGGR